MKAPFEGAKENWYRMVCKMVGEMELRINDLNKRLDKQEEIIQRLNLERSSLKIILTKAAERLEYIESFLEDMTRQMGGEVYDEEDEDLAEDRTIN